MSLPSGCRGRVPRRFFKLYSIQYDRDKTNIFLITSDGKNIPVKFGTGTGTPYNGKPGIYSYDYELVYPGENDKEEIIDTENVTAISVNGTVYELK